MSNHKEIIERTANHIGLISIGSLETMVSEIRLKDRDELIKTLPGEKYVSKITGYTFNEGKKVGYNQCLEEIKHLIQDYYNK